MPRYDYDCAACGRRFEATHGVFEDGPTACPLCGSGPVKKAFSPPTIHFKGSGWAKKERQASTASRASRSTSASGEDATSGGTSDGAAKDGSATDGGSVSSPAITDTNPTTTKTPTAAASSPAGGSSAD